MKVYSSTIKKVTAILSFLLLSIFCNAQDFSPVFTRINTDDGLSNDWVNKIYQDKNGFLWFCTISGLNKYDGKEITTYRKEENKKYSIGNDKTWDIIQGDGEELWIATEGGVFIFDPLSEKFTPLKIKNKEHGNEQLNSFTTFSRLFKPISDNELLIGTTIGLRIYNKKTNEIGNFSTVKNLHNRNISHLRVDKRNMLWISTYGYGLFIYNLNTNECINYSDTTTGRNPMNSDSPLCTFEDSKGDIYIGTEKGLSIFYKEEKVFQNFTHNPNNKNGPPQGGIRTIFEDSRKNLWIAFQYGITIFDRTHKKFYKFPHKGTDLSTIAGNEIWSIYEDKKGTVWFGGYNSGISKLDYEKSVFRKFKQEDTNIGLNENSVLRFLEDKSGNIWIATDHGGLNYYNRENGVFTYYINDPLNPNSLSSNAVLDIIDGANGTLWIGTWGGGLNHFNPATNRFKVYQPEGFGTQTLNSLHAWALCMDDTGNVWVGTNDALNYLNTKTEIVSYLGSSQSSSSLSDNFVRDIKMDQNSNIWIGTGNGLNKYQPKNNELKKYLVDSIGYTEISNIYIDSENYVWVTSIGKGVFKINPKTEEIKRYSIENGLPTNNITSILIDKKGFLWLGTLESGICWFDTENGLIKSFEKNDGLQGNSFNYASALQLRSGEMLFGGKKGFNLFHPDSVKINNYIPPVVITGLDVFNKPVEPGEKDSPINKSISFSDSIILNHNQSIFTIHFAALAYTSPEKNQYAYRLEGFNEQWQFVGNKQEATYTNIDPGNYIFRVKASNNDGIWNEKGKSIVVIILPPWWETLWFRILVIGLAVSAIVGFYLNRMNRMKVRENYLKLKVKERTQELQETNIVLEQKQIEIHSKNQELESSEEELKQLNEELNASNDFLSQRKDELEKALHELKNAQAQLVHAEKMASLGILTAGVAHEINNPLNFIEGGKVAIEQYIRENLDKHIDNLGPLLDIIGSGVERTNAIVSSLNRFNRKSSSIKERCNINLIIENCLIILENKLKHRIHIEKDFTKTPANIMANEGELHQVFLNILTNAVQAIKDKGTIAIKTKVKDDELFIEISDTGYGISEENIKKVTDPFFTTKAPGEGTGLGMSIAYSIIRRHKGTIIYESEIGKWTKVVLFFPVDS